MNYDYNKKWLKLIKKLKIMDIILKIIKKFYTNLEINHSID